MPTTASRATSTSTTTTALSLRTGGLDAIRRVPQVRGELARPARRPAPRPRFSPVWTNTVGTGAAAIDVERLGSSRWAFKWGGFNAQGEYFNEDTENQSRVKGNNTGGYFFQAGCLFPGNKFEIATRYEDIQRDGAFSVTNLGSALKDFEGTGLGVSYYLNSMSTRSRPTGSARNKKVTGRGLDELRVQLQVIF